jgi:wyosine [tRNA(Phe)-imidazoG37] synthetase (radical SAM superfamily)
MQYIFGPVTSRRFGKSLGINIVPFKVCSYDCIYCEVGRTTKKIIERKSYVEIDELVKEFNEVYNKNRGNIDVITITGQGEPTLNAQLGEIILKLQSLATTPILVLTNGSLLFDKEVRATLNSATMVCTSLDAVVPEIFYKINNPVLNISVSNIIDGLIEFSFFYPGQLFIEVLFVKGYNDDIEHIDRVINIIRKCKYRSVQVNTVFRPPAYPAASPVNEVELLNIQKYIEDKGIRIQKEHYEYKKTTITEEILEEYILNTTALRPLCIEEITKIFDITTFEIDKIIQKHIMSKKLIAWIYGDKKYYIKSSNRRSEKNAI